jgi:glucose-6-phosphate dehydrogenase assembly protein OpcA
MKTKIVLTTLAIGAICQFAPQTSHAQDVDSIAPVVVKTVPEAGTKDVAPGEMEIKVTFSKEMTDQSWSWATAWQDSTPEGTDKPHYDASHKTCLLKVKLEPNKTYGYWINSQRFHGFQDLQNHPAVPYLLVFQTRSN